MKKFLMLISVSLLSGCGILLESYLMKYDANEYKLITNIRTLAGDHKQHCANQDISKINAKDMSLQTTNFKNYSQYLPHNSKVIAASQELDKISQGLNSQYQKGSVSPAFCKIKFESIEKSAETMQKIIGDKPR
jgi:hypothetical protein